MATLRRMLTRASIEWVPHYSELSPDIHERLAARGIDPERSTEAWLQAIREGDFPLTAGLPSRRHLRGAHHNAPGKSLMPIPLAVVIP